MYMDGGQGQANEPRRKVRDGKKRYSNYVCVSTCFESFNYKTLYTRADTVALPLFSCEKKIKRDITIWYRLTLVNSKSILIDACLVEICEIE